MTFGEFCKLVAAMRSAQKLYFRDRTQSNLFTAKDLERQVDEALLTGVEVISSESPLQKMLFPREES